MAVARESTGVASLDEALRAIVERAAELAGADVVVARLLDESGSFVAQAVHAPSESVRAELEGTKLDAGAAVDETSDPEHLPQAMQLAAERVSAVGVLQLPVRDNGDVVGSLELLRSRSDFDERQQKLARAAADEVALARRAFRDKDAASAPDPLELAGDALAAASDEMRAADQVAALAAEATGALACLVWRYETEGNPVLAGLSGRAAAVPVPAGEAARKAQESREPVMLEPLEHDVPRGPTLATLQLGEPPLGALQLLFSERPEEGGPLLPRLVTFAVRAAHALRANERRRSLAVDLERTRALLAIVGQAIAELSLAHTLDTAVERVRELLAAERLAIYLVEEGDRLETAAEQGLTGPHVRIGERLLELALGPARGRGLVLVRDASREPRLRGIRGAVEELGIEAAVGVPLRAGEELVGLLAVYPERGRLLTENEESLLLALAAQLAVAVQNAQLHEETKRLGTERSAALDAEREASRRLRALYDISRSFTESLSLDETLDTAARTIVETLGVDGAVLRMPHERGDALVPVAVHVREERLDNPIREILSLPQPLSPLRPSVFPSGSPVVLDPATAQALGAAHQPLIPFLEKGSTAAVIPLATQEEILGTLTLLSLDADHPIAGDTLESAISIAGQTALALDNARLYQERKEFAEAMQRSLLPRHRPDLPGLEIGDVYASSALVEVGGDVYDFLELPDGRLAVVLGDVTGHGIDAAADMAMTKFVFRSLAREHAEPGDFLAAANEVVLGEIAAAKFITLLYLTVDPQTGELACASAGHPAPRVVSPGRAPQPLAVAGMALGIEARQQYATAQVRLEQGAAVVLYTDGLVEARREGELYGEERLDASLLRNAELPSHELAEALASDCRAFAGELGDDLAVVVLKRTG